MARKGALRLADLRRRSEEPTDRPVSAMPRSARADYLAALAEAETKVESRIGRWNASLSAAARGYLHRRQEIHQFRSAPSLHRSVPGDGAGRTHSVASNRSSVAQSLGDAQTRRFDRERAFYVDPIDTGWSRSCLAFSRHQAERILCDALNDYRGQYDPTNRK